MRRLFFDSSRHEGRHFHAVAVPDLRQAADAGEGGVRAQDQRVGEEAGGEITMRQIIKGKFHE